jgi:hypothetical protein
VNAHARSGETRRRFCARHDIALSTFAWWQQRVRAKARSAVAPPYDDADTNALFVELAAPAQVAPEPSPAAWAVELELGAGVVLRLRRAV